MSKGYTFCREQGSKGENGANRGEEMNNFYGCCL